MDWKVAWAGPSSVHQLATTLCQERNQDLSCEEQWMYLSWGLRYDSADSQRWSTFQCYGECSGKWDTTAAEAKFCAVGLERKGWRQWCFKNEQEGMEKASGPMWMKRKKAERGLIAAEPWRWCGMPSWRSLICCVIFPLTVPTNR